MNMSEDHKLCGEDKGMLWLNYDGICAAITQFACLKNTY